MQVRVTLLRTKGVRRSREEIAADPGLLGELTLEDGRSGNHYGRAIRVANLRTPRGAGGASMVDALVPLTDPALVRINGRTLVLVGFETDYDAQTDRHAEHAQGWLVRLG